jgi:hypothetical protein
LVIENDARMGYDGSSFDDASSPSSFSPSSNSLSPSPDWISEIENMSRILYLPNSGDDQTLLHRTAGTETGGVVLFVPKFTRYCHFVVSNCVLDLQDKTRKERNRQSHPRSTQPEKKAVLTCQMPSALNVFRNSGSDPSLLDSFSYCSSSASFCESASSAAHKKKRRAD